MQSFEFPINKEGQQNQGSGCQIITSCDLTGGSVTITTPSIQSGGCLIQSTDSSILMQTPHVEIRPKLSGGGCFMQKTLSTENQEASVILPEHKNQQEGVNQNERTFLLPPSGCQELPGIRRNMLPQETVVGNFTDANCEEKPVFSSFQVTNVPVMQFQQAKSSKKGEQELEQNKNFNCCCNNVQNLYHVKSNSLPVSENHNSVVLNSNPGVQIQVNATVQLPASLGQCTVNITATTTNSPNSASGITAKTKNNFNGGGLVQENETQNDEENFEESRDRTPTTPISWLMPCPWSFDSYMMDRDAARLSKVKRLLQTCGWYHEGLSWQQSENLLKNAAVGRWLMRDSSDSRYMFAVSVQTARGPTSVRVHYFVGQFRLDAEPSLAFAIPLFDCPIKMLEYYVEYSKSVDEHRKEVWVDYSGQLYSPIYLTKPLVKEVRSLSHLARLVVNRYKLLTEHLPPLIRNYLAEYPYTL
ncbi:Suppressor of cytokine signaling 2 [Habropoda laboriosa]|uniref:Suppressor of cytokine signaling 2 n=2 Tax=Habropoda laboriosa TaxID=597456 RepID=A0A0L7QXZ6_9HYME|nr:Suppressor of cytokine signaling 2 [Habropoda laboriosa]